MDVIHFVGVSAALQEILPAVVPRLNASICEHESIQLFEQSSERNPGASVLCAVECEWLTPLQSRFIRMGHPATVYVAETPSLTDVVVVMRNGAVSVLETPVDPEWLRRALELALRKRELLSLTRPTREAASRIERLSEYDQNLLNLIKGGSSSKELARLLNVSPRTIERRRSLILEQLEVRSMSEAVSLATRAEYACMFDHESAEF